MFPTIKSGQFVVVRKKPPVNPIGKLIVFENQGLLKIKRIKMSDHNNFWVLGDNLEFSQDSRHFGAVSKQVVKGFVIKVI